MQGCNENQGQSECRTEVHPGHFPQAFEDVNRQWVFVFVLQRLYLVLRYYRLSVRILDTSMSVIFINISKIHYVMLSY